MFPRTILPNSIDEDNKQDIQQLLANINRIEELFQDTNNLPSLELKQLMENNNLQLKSISSDEEDPDAENPIKNLCENAINSNVESSDAILTRSKFLDAILEDWFDKQTVALLISGRLPNDGHDAKEDMFKFAQELAMEMKTNQQTKISPEMSNLWKRFFTTNNLDTIRGCEACPLIKNGNGYSFISDKLIPYFVNRAMFIQSQEYQHRV